MLEEFVINKVTNAYISMCICGMNRRRISGSVLIELWIRRSVEIGEDPVRRLSYG